MRTFWMGLAGLGLAVLALLFALNLLYEERLLSPSEKPGAMPQLASNSDLITVNTTRVGSDDPVETAVAVAQIIYPATEEENVPGAVVLVNRDNLAEVMVAASRVQHFPVNAPLLYVERDSIPALTRAELLRLKPEGVPMDGNVQVYLIGTIGDAVRREVEDLGFRTRTLRGAGPVALSQVVDDWTSTIHGDFRNEIVVANLDNLPAAIPSMYWNAHAGDGLVFVTNEGVPETTRRMLERRANGPWLYLFGDESVIPAAVARELAQYGHVTRMPRADLPALSAFFAGHHDSGRNWGGWVVDSARSFGWGNAEAGRNAIFVSLDGPGSWQNAVIATTLSHMGKHGPVLFINRDSVPEDVANYLRILKPYATAPQQQLLNHGWVIGGEGTISWQTQATIDRMLEAYTRAQASAAR